MERDLAGPGRDRVFRLLNAARRSTWNNGGGNEEEAVLDARRLQRLLDALFTTETMLGTFSDHGRLQGILDFEASLARAAARVRLMSAGAAAAIGTQCRTGLLDVDAL